MATSIRPSETNDVNPFTVNSLSQGTVTQIQGLESEGENHESCCQNLCCSCFNQWWNVKFNHQRSIIHVVEKTAFHIGIIILVIVDCFLVLGELLLDFIDLNEKCKNTDKDSTHSEESGGSKLELAIEILHYGSIALLAIFVLEVIIKVYAYGRKWWNIRERKMEWLDALVVILSFAADIYFLKHPSAIAEITLLLIAFRFWRIFRILNSVAQSIRSNGETAKKHLAETYMQVIEALLNLSAKKTDIASELRRTLTVTHVDKIIQTFAATDRSCREVLKHCEESSSKTTVSEIAKSLQDVLEQMRLSS